jgi:hypothetical protein
MLQINPLSDCTICSGIVVHIARNNQPSELECELWKKRNVNIYDIKVDDFVTEMQKYMK